MDPLHDRRLVVVGASAGLGRAFALQAVRRGARTVLVGRREDRLLELVEEAGGGIPVVADITDEDDCARIADVVRDELGGIDVMLQAAGAAPLRRLVDTTKSDWRLVLDTNIIGTHQIICATLPLLTPSAIVAVFSSEAIGQPRAGLAAYAASKAGLEELLGGWRNEHPGLRFSCIRVGTTVPTEFARSFDLELLPALLEDWTMKGVAQASFMSPDDVGAFLADTLGAALPYPDVGIEHLTVRSPSAVVNTAAAMVETANETLGPVPS